MIRRVDWLRVLLVFCVLGVSHHAEAATVRVTTTAQHAAPGEGCTITDAIVTTQLDMATGNCTIVEGGAGYTVLIPDGTYVLTMPYGGLYLDESATAFPIITRPITILGEGPNTLIIRDPNAPAFRLFRVQSGLDIRHLTLSGGDAGINCCGVKLKGAAIYGDDLFAACGPLGAGCHVSIVVRDVTFENNVAGAGGAISDLFNYVGVGVEFTIEDSTFRNNHADLGGAIHIAPTGLATIRRSRFEDNTAAQTGGAIFSPTGGQIEVEDTQFARNRALNQDGGAVQAHNLRLTRVAMRDNTSHTIGGAIANYGGVATIIDSTFEGNSSRRGGAVHTLGRLVVSGSTFSGNHATESDGGAIFLDDRTGASRITNSTFSANRAFVEGTAISVFSGGLTLVNDTIIGNTSAGSWGAAVRGYWDTPSVWISNSIVAGNTTEGYPLDVVVDGPRLFSLGSNLIGNHEGTNGAFVQLGDQTGTPGSPLNPGLLPLADNGGPTYTHALAPGSLALDAGSVLPPGTDDACESVDQRGTPRPAGTRCDIGAFEAAAAAQQYQLDLSWTSGGTITDGTGAPLCPNSPCSLTYDEGVLVTLVANPGLLATFSGWTGDCAGVSATCVVTMSESRQVGAAFALMPQQTRTTAYPATSDVGGPVTLAARIDRVPDLAPVSGMTVTFRLASTLEILGTAISAGSGYAILQIATTSLPAGQYQFTASFDGEEGFLPSSSSSTWTVVGAPALPTTTSVTSSANPSTSGQPVTFRAIVAAVAAGAATPVGEVSFVYVPTNTWLRTVAVDGGTAAFTTSELPEGTFGIQAIFTGYGAFAGSTAALTQVVSPAASTPIRNGDPEDRAQFNNVGMILAGPGHGACTATLVSPLVVLTAAHCLRDDSPDPIFEFSLGPGHTARMTTIRMHPQFMTFDGLNLTFDIALGLLDRTVASSWSDIIPAVMQDAGVAIGEPATAVGFGEAGRVSGALTPTQYLGGEGVPGAFVPDAFLEVQPANVNNQMFCNAGVGGPLFHQDQIVGVASFRFVETCAEPGAGYYVATARLADWIRTGANDLEADPRELTVDVDAGGVVSGLSSGDCEGQCSETFIQGTFVELTAGPKPGFLFTQWVGCDFVDDWAGGTTCWVTMNAARTVTAQFEPIMYGLTVEVIGPGTVARDPAGDSYVHGSTVTLTAQPERRFRFSHWGAGCSSMSGAICTVQMYSPRTITAYFIDPRRSPTARITQQPTGVIEATGPLTPVSLSGATSSDPDSTGPLTFLWTIDSQSGIGTGETFTPALSLGVHVVTLVVTDADGLTGHTTKTITVKDRTAPVLVFPSGLTLSAGALSIALPPNTVTAVDLVYGSQPVSCTPELLWLGSNTVRCESVDPRGNRRRGTFIVTVVFPALTAQADLLLAATQQAPGATNAMINAASRLVNGIANGNQNTVCPNVESYGDAVQNARSRGRISGATADGLLTLLGGVSTLAGCVP